MTDIDPTYHLNEIGEALTALGVLLKAIQERPPDPTLTGAMFAVLEDTDTHYQALDKHLNGTADA